MKWTCRALAPIFVYVPPPPNRRITPIPDYVFFLVLFSLTLLRSFFFPSETFALFFFSPLLFPLPSDLMAPSAGSFLVPKVFDSARHPCYFVGLHGAKGFPATLHPLDPSQRGGSRRARFFFPPFPFSEPACAFLAEHGIITSKRSSF